MNKDDSQFRVAAVQMAPVLFDRDGTTEKVIDIIKRCGVDGIRLVVFPETIIPNYPYFAMFNPPIFIGEYTQRLFDQAVDVPGSVTDAIGKAARESETVVVIGVNERDGGTLYNTQLIFDSDGILLGKRRKIMPTHQERLIWGWGDGSGLRTFDTSVGRIGALICWEHYMPLARYTLIAKGEQIHCSHFPGSMLGDRMANQLDAAVRHHAMESGAFVVNATGWLTGEQRREICKDESLEGLLSGGQCTAVVSPSGEYLAGPLPEGEDLAIAEINLNDITRQKNVLDTAGHYARPDLFELFVDTTRRKIITETDLTDNAQDKESPEE